MSAVQPASDSVGPTGFDPHFVEHADRCWEAERENAERMQSRVRLLLSAVSAIFGIGLLKANDFRADLDGWALWAVMATAALGLVFLAFAFGSIFGVRRLRTGVVEQRERHAPGREPARVRVRSASDHLARPAESYLNPPRDPDEVRKLVFARICRAFLDLRERDARQESAVDRGQQWLLLGLLLLTLAVGIRIAVHSSESQNALEPSSPSTTTQRVGKPGPPG
jgi:hypothetical protein